MSAQKLSDRFAPKAASNTYLVSNAVIIPGPYLPFLPNGALAIENGRIKDIGDSTKLKQTYSSWLEIDATGTVIIPGLFNAHTHVAMGFFRGLGHGRENMIESFLFPAEKSLTPELLKPLSYSYILDGLTSGVTAFADHYYFSEGIGRAFEAMGVRGWLGETIADLGGAFPGRESFDRARKLMEQTTFSSLIKHVIAPHAADTLSKELLTEVSSFAKKHQLPLHMHLSQTKGEKERVAKRERTTPVAFAEACGALGPHSLVVHLTSATQDDLKILKHSDSTVGWCPSSTVIYESLAPVWAMLENQIPMAIGTDCAASCDHADMLSEMRTGGLFAKDRGHALSPDDLLAMATTVPAKVLGVDNQLGTLEVGKNADFVALNIGLIGKPIQNPLANVIYSLGARAVSHVAVDGNWVLWNRNLVKVSEGDLEAEYAAAVLEIHKRVGGLKNL